MGWEGEAIELNDFILNDFGETDNATIVLAFLVSPLIDIPQLIWLLEKINPAGSISIGVSRRSDMLSRDG